MARITSIAREYRKLAYEQKAREKRAKIARKKQIQKVEVAIETLLIGEKIYNNHFKMIRFFQRKLEILTQ